MNCRSVLWIGLGLAVTATGPAAAQEPPAEPASDEAAPGEAEFEQRRAA